MGIFLQHLWFWCISRFTPVSEMSVNINLFHNSHLGLKGLDELFTVAQVQTLLSLLLFFGTQKLQTILSHFPYSLGITVCYLLCSKKKSWLSSKAHYWWSLTFLGRSLYCIYCVCLWLRYVLCGCSCLQMVSSSKAKCVVLFDYLSKLWL